MRIAVVGADEGFYLHDLRRAAGTEHCVEAVAFSDLACGVDDGGVRVVARGQDLADFDVLHLRTMSAGSLEQVVFRMDALERLRAAGKAVVNPPRTIELAVDKFLTTARLREAGLPVPRTWTGQDADGALEAFERLGRDVVVKPLFGSQGRGLFRLQDPDAADRAFRMLMQLGAVLYVQEFVAHPGSDLRVLIVGDERWSVERRHPTDWRTNVSRGAVAVPHRLTPEEDRLASAAAQAVGASLAGVDLVYDPSGRLMVLEVNAVPGWKGLAEALRVDVAARVVAHLVECARDSAAGAKTSPSATA